MCSWKHSVGTLSWDVEGQSSEQNFPSIIMSSGAEDWRNIVLFTAQEGFRLNMTADIAWREWVDCFQTLFSVLYVLYWVSTVTLEQWAQTWWIWPLSILALIASNYHALPTCQCLAFWSCLFYSPANTKHQATVILWLWTTVISQEDQCWNYWGFTKAMSTLRTNPKEMIVQPALNEDLTIVAVEALLYWQKAGEHLGTWFPGGNWEVVKGAHGRERFGKQYCHVRWERRGGLSLENLLWLGNLVNCTDLVAARSSILSYLSEETTKKPVLA